MINVDELEIRSWRPQGGDVLVVRNTEVELFPDQVAEIKAKIKQVLDLPDSVKIMVVGRDWEIVCVREEQ